jgi:hypothetical protein
MIETAISKALEKRNDYLIEKNYSFSPGRFLRKKAKGKSSFKDKIPLCNWTMPAQPEGYIRGGKYDLL